MAQVIVDYNLCEGHGMCEQAAPEYFRLDEDGAVQRAADEVPQELSALVQAAISGCPVAAIQWQE